MTWKELELIFNRAFRFTLSRRKLLFTAPVLIFCGLVSVFCRALASSTSDWLASSVTFLPIFFCTPVLLVAGIILMRIYHHEVKGLPASYRRTFQRSKELILEVVVLAVPIILLYLVMWTLLGLFYLVKEIPYVGEGLGILFSFGPFLLLLGSFVLTLLIVSMLFFATPLMALKGIVGKEVLVQALDRFKLNPLSNISLILLSLVPLLFTSALMTLAAVMTGKTYSVTETSFTACLQWFCIMIPFCALLTPGVIFFFNFAMESHALMQKKSQNTPCESPS